MTFNTSKNKIQKIWNDSTGNRFEIDVLSDNDKIILSKTNQLNRISTIYKNITDFSSDWLTPETKTRDFGGDYMGRNIEVWRYFKEYSVEINGINKNFIPFIDLKISYRLGDGIPSAPIPDDPFSPGMPFDEGATIEINNITEIKPNIEENSNDLIKNINYISFIYIYGWDGLPANLQIKFYISLINPNHYQST